MWKRRRKYTFFQSDDQSQTIRKEYLFAFFNRHIFPIIIVFHPHCKREMQEGSTIQKKSFHT
ncbi:MAG: hypothetical protein UDO44_06540 [Prevotella sp.]|nr:hypothetical protein [Prevotella sp.]